MEEILISVPKKDFSLHSGVSGFKIQHVTLNDVTDMC